MRKLVFTIALTVSAMNALGQQAFYDVTAATGNGLRLWSSNDYKIHLGIGAEYSYGPVSDYGMKFNMNTTPGRGWVWGINGLTPVAAIGTAGDMKIAGVFNTQGISLDRSAWPYILFSENGVLGARIQGTGGMFAVTSTNGASNWLTVNSASGLVGIGTNSPVSKLDMRGGYLNVVGYNPNDYTFVARSADPGNNDSYFYERITTNFHILGTGKNGTGLQRKLGFALGGSDSEADVKMMINSSGDVGIGTTSPTARFQVVSSAGGSNTATFMAPASGPNTSYIHWGNAGDWYIRSAAGTGKVIIQDSGGNVGIGTANPNQKLTVNGTIYGKEVKVDLSVPGPDYVFSKTYSLRSLKDVESYIEENQHLPEVPSAAQMEKDGIMVGEMNILLLKKVEELTLYVIKLQKEVDELKQVKKQ